MADRVTLDPPDLPELEPAELDAAGEHGELRLTAGLVEHSDHEPVAARRIRIRESELRGVALEARRAAELSLSDVVLRDCDLSNVDGRGGSLRRVEVQRSRLVGFSLGEGQIEDLRVLDSSLMLASFAGSRMRNAAFERVNLAEASFIEARLEAVEFVDCKLEGADFRGAKLRDCIIRGSSLDGILGVESLAGVTMSWSDIVASAAALAAAVGITVESDAC